MNRVGILVVLSCFSAVATLSAAPVRACDCEFPTVDQALERADVVVVATFVRESDHSQSRRYRRSVVEYVARVGRAWKGARAGETISLWDTGSSCDTIGRPWRGARLFFARRDETGRLRPEYCDAPTFSYRVTLAARIARVDAAARDAAARPVVPAQTPSAPVPASGRPPAPVGAPRSGAAESGRAR